MGGYGGMALARESMIPLMGQSPQPAMGQALNLAGLLQAQNQQRQLFPGEMQLQEQRVQANQMALAQAQQQQQDEAQFKQSLLENGGDWGKALQSVSGKVSPSFQQMAMGQWAKAQDQLANWSKEQRAEFQDKQTQARGVYNSLAQLQGPAFAAALPQAQAALAGIDPRYARMIQPGMTPDQLRQGLGLTLGIENKLLTLKPGEQYGSVSSTGQFTPTYTAPTKTVTPVPGRDVPFPPAVEAQRIREHNAERQPPDKGVTLLVPAPNGQPQVIRAQPGDVLPQGAVTPQQYGSTVTPTSQIRTQAENAQQMLRLIDQITPRIDALDKQGKLGPMSGRYQNFLRGKVGNGDPDYTFLSTLNELSQTLALQAHMGSRGAAQVLDKFTAMLDAGKMDAPTLKAAYGAARLYFADRAKSGQIKGWGNNGAPAGGNSGNFFSQFGGTAR